jgi:hypothetical protein
MLALYYHIPPFLEAIQEAEAPPLEAWRNADFRFFWGPVRPKQHVPELEDMREIVHHVAMVHRMESRGREEGGV